MYRIWPRNDAIGIHKPDQDHLRERKFSVVDIDITKMSTKTRTFFTIGKSGFVEEFSVAVTIPYTDIFRLKFLGICTAPDEPQQLFSYTTEEYFFRRQQGKCLIS